MERDTPTLPQVVDAASARELIGALDARLRAAGIAPGEGVVVKAQNGQLEVLGKVQP